MVKVGQLVNVLDLDTNDAIFLGLVLAINSQLGTATVSLTSKEDFVGNSRLLLGDYLIYPAIQTTVWTCQLAGVNLVGLSKSDAIALCAWPSLRKDSKSVLAESLGLKLQLGKLQDELPISFKSLIEKMADVSSSVFDTINEEIFASSEWYNELCQNHPRRAAVLDHRVTEMARRDFEKTRVRLDLIQSSFASPENRDAARLLLRREFGTKNRVKGSNSAKKCAQIAEEKGLAAVAVITSSKSRRPKSFEVNGKKIWVHEILLGVL